jgi:hypothetical protein
VTDVLDLGHDALDDFTSTAETKPKAAEKPVDVTTCRYCPKTFDGGPARYVRRGTHEKKEHHDQWQAAKAGVSKPKKATAKKSTTPKAKTTVTGPKSKRVSAADSIGRNLARLGKLIGNVDGPVGRAVFFSAPATGTAVDELVAGTVVDRVAIQPFANYADKWEKFGGIVAFPILIALISKNPDLYPVLEDDLREATLDVIIASIPTFEKQARKEKQAVDALARLRKIDERYANAEDPILLILQDIFQPTPPPEGDGAD